VHFEGTVSIAAPRSAVWEFVTDPERVGSCGPGVESVETLDDLIDHTVGRLIDTIGIRLDHDLSKRWTGPDERRASRRRAGIATESDAPAGD
jgi:hypothetical protein